MKWLLALGFGLVPLFCSCNKRDSVSIVPDTNRPVAVPAGEPQPRLETINLWIGPHEIKAEMALTGRQQQMGMMFRKGIEENEGMLFVFKNPGQLGFYMRNTFVPLSLAYIDPEGLIVDIRDLEPLNSNTVMSSSANVQYALETARGWFERHQVKPGTLVRTSRGSLAKVFFGRPD